MSLGGVFGRGEFAEQLFRSLRRRGVAHDQMMVILNGSAHPTMCPSMARVPTYGPKDIARGIERLRNNGVDRLVYGGDLRFLPGDSMDVQSGLTQGQITVRVARAIEKNGIEAVHASELKPRWAVRSGWIVRPRRRNAALTARLEEIAASTARQALAKLGDEPKERSVRQAYLFDDEEFVRVTPCDGTDKLLEVAASDGPKKDRRVIRTLVKVAGSRLDPNLDPPVFQPKTLLGAARADVDLIVLAAKSGIIFERADVVKACRRKIRIFIYGCDRTVPSARA